MRVAILVLCCFQAISVRIKPPATIGSVTFNSTSQLHNLNRFGQCLRSETPEYAQPSQRSYSFLEVSPELQEAAKQCPPVASSSEYIEESAIGKSTEELSQEIGTENCKRSSEQYICRFPPLGWVQHRRFQSKPADVLEYGVLNGNSRFLNKHVLAEVGDDQHDENTAWIVEYYADWCGHCKQFAAKWFALGVLLSESGATARLVSVNCIQHPTACADVTGYPTFKWFYNGRNKAIKDGIETYLSGAAARNAKVFQKVETELRAQGISALQAPLYVSQYGLLEKVHADVTEVQSGEMSDHNLEEFILGLPERPSLESVSQALSNDEAFECPSTRLAIDANVSLATDSLKTDIAWPEHEQGATADIRIADASYMLLYTLKNWVQPSLSEDAFSPEDLKALMTWLDVVSHNFPVSRGDLSALHDAVAKEASGAGLLCAATWRVLLAGLEEATDKIPTRPPQGDGACTTDTCRIWSLFHILATAPAVGVRGALGPEESLEGIVTFISKYFKCEVCRRHALEQVEKGSYGKDELLEKPEGLALYLWRFHNAVSVRIAAETGCKGDRRWPPVDLCPSCWRESKQSWDVLDEAKDLFKSEDMMTQGYLPVEEEVLKFLVDSFWPNRPSRRLSLRADSQVGTSQLPNTSMDDNFRHTPTTWNAQAPSFIPQSKPAPISTASPTLEPASSQAPALSEAHRPPVSSMPWFRGPPPGSSHEQGEVSLPETKTGQAAAPGSSPRVEGKVSESDGDDADEEESKPGKHSWLFGPGGLLMLGVTASALLCRCLSV